MFKHWTCSVLDCVQAPEDYGRWRCMVIASHGQSVKGCFHEHSSLPWWDLKQQQWPYIIYGRQSECDKTHAGDSYLLSLDQTSSLDVYNILTIWGKHRLRRYMLVWIQGSQVAKTHFRELPTAPPPPPPPPPTTPRPTQHTPNLLPPRPTTHTHTHKNFRAPGPRCIKGPLLIVVYRGWGDLGVLPPDFLFSGAFWGWPIPKFNQIHTLHPDLLILRGWLHAKAWDSGPLGGALQ